MDKINRYERILNKAVPILKESKMDDIGKMSIIASILKTEFNEWIFCGFYRVVKERLLEIGPYQGNVIACSHIHFDNGVCGAAATLNKTIIVKDVLSFPNYIACDSDTVSEIVVPLIKNKKLLAVLDIDGHKIGQFDEDDKSYLEKILLLI